jgi:membrane fusion protein (multidrug efflux system)
VGVLTIEPRELQLNVELPGRTSAYLVAEVRPQVSGIIRERRFTEGAEVVRGAPLYVIDPDTYQAEVATAEAALAKAEAAANTARLRAERFRALVARHAVSQQDADDANAAEQQAVAEVAQQRAQLARARIDLCHASSSTGRSSPGSSPSSSCWPARWPSAAADLEQYPDIAPPRSRQRDLPGRLGAGRGGLGHAGHRAAMKGLDGLIYMSATSDSAGRSRVTLTFEAGTDPDIAQVQVQNKLQLAHAAAAAGRCSSRA